MDKVVRPIFLLTDFGTHDHYVGQVRGVIASLAPGAPIHDITHEVEPFAIDEGAWLLETALPSLPPDAVVMAVVDPGVGSERRPIAVTSAGRAFIGPDNGLLSPALPGDAVHEIAMEGEPAPSATFHGRDVFAPAAARLAAGFPITKLGPPCTPAHRLPAFRGVPAGEGFDGCVIHIDRYGNLITTITAGQAGAAYRLRLGDVAIDGPSRTFSDVPPGELLSHVDSSGFIAIAQNQGDAARSLGVSRRAPVRVDPR